MLYANVDVFCQLPLSISVFAFQKLKREKSLKNGFTGQILLTVSFSDNKYRRIYGRLFFK
jgi:hypothetical protein